MSGQVYISTSNAYPPKSLIEFIVVFLMLDILSELKLSI